MAMMCDGTIRWRCAARVSHDASQSAALDAYLARTGSAGAERFLPKDDDDLNHALCERRFDRVVFADLDALLEAIWKGEAELDRWNEAGIQIDLVCPPTRDEDAWRPFASITYDSLVRWRKAQRRRQIVAGTILSAIALAAMAVLFCLIPPAR
jgi:hypothetical protein